jgi:hypothetical protein
MLGQPGCRRIFSIADNRDKVMGRNLISIQHFVTLQARLVLVTEMIDLLNNIKHCSQ